MKLRKIFHVSLFLIAFLGVFSLTGVLFAQVQKTWYVPDDFSTIQGAIDNDQVMSGDEIVVRDGTYHENITFHAAKALEVHSENDASSTILDGDQTGTVVTFESGVGQDTILDGFTIRNGHAANGGGGISCDGASPKIRNNMIEENIAVCGGGVFCVNGSNPLIRNNTIASNYASYGGGIYCGSNSNPEITGNMIREHENDGGSSAGGGICCDASSPTIEGNTLIFNKAVFGGGIACRAGSSSIIKNNYIGTQDTESGPTDCGNSAQYGGGIYCEASSPVIGGNDGGNHISYNDVFYYSLYNGKGGGICIEGYDAQIVYVAKNYINHNKGRIMGGGVFVESSKANIEYNKIRYNNTTGTQLGEGGGGIYISDPEDVKVKWNWIEENADTFSGYGGGINVTMIQQGTGQVEINSNSIRHNTVETAGGGIYYDGQTATAKIWNNLLAENQVNPGYFGGGIYIASGDPQFWNNTLTQNSVTSLQGQGQGKGIYCAAGVTADIRNSIIYDNLPASVSTEIFPFPTVGGPQTVEYCDFEGGSPSTGTGNFDAPPVYLSTLYYKLDGSVYNPCIDTGDPSYPNRFPPYDFEYETRPYGVRCDVGWDEYH